jgi:hypothetical protein
MSSNDEKAGATNSNRASRKVLAVGISTGKKNQCRLNHDE